MSTALFYLVQTPEVSMTFIGGPLLPAEPGFVWLTNPSGKPVFKVQESYVQQSTKEEVAQRILDDKRAAKAKNN
jgi:hypothetical protein